MTAARRQPGSRTDFQTGSEIWWAPIQVLPGTCSPSGHNNYCGESILLRLLVLLVLVLIAPFAVACAGLPVAGPLTSEVIANGRTSNPSHLDYVVVDLTESVCRLLSDRAPESFAGKFGDIGAPPSY